MGQSREQSPGERVARRVAPVNSAFAATEALTRTAGPGTGVGPGNLFGAGARAAGLTQTTASGAQALSPLGTGVAALGPLASLAAGGLNTYEGASSIAEDGLGWRNGLQTTGGVAGLVGGAGGLAALAGGTGALAAAGPYGAAAAAGIGLGLRGDTFMQDHFGFGVGDMVSGTGDAFSGAAEWMGASEDGLISQGAGYLGNAVGAVGGAATAVVSGVGGVAEDIGGWVGSWFD